MSGTQGARYATGSANGSVRIVHREYIRDIQGSTNFSQSVLPLNPGLAETFPFLSQVADAYEEFRIRGLVFEYKSTSSEYVFNTGGSGSSGALGTVIMATNYNAAISPPFTDKKSMENYQYAQSAPPTRNMLHQVECRGAGTPLKTMYLRTGPQAPQTDIRMYDLGNFSIATQGMITEVDNATIGELWVAYDVEFFKPKYRTLGSKTDHFALRWDSGEPSSSNLVGGMSDTTPFGTAPLIDRLHPVLGPNNPSNGVFGGTSKIVNVVGDKSYLYLPENPGAMYKVSVFVHTADPFGQLRTDGAMPNWGQTLQSCERVFDWMNNWEAAGPAAPFVAGATSDMNSRCWMVVNVFRILPFDKASPPWVSWVVEASATTNAYNIDIFVEQVNPEYYINPATL